MKYSAESFILKNGGRDPSLKNYKGVLLYGFDEHLIQVLEQEVLALFKTRIVRTTQTEVQNNLEIINPSIDMFSKESAELVVIENTTDTFLKILETKTFHVKLLLKGDLKSKSKLIKFVEDQKDWASIACYESHLGTAEALMTAHLGKVIPEFLPLAKDALELKNQINIEKILASTNFNNQSFTLNQSSATLAASLLEYALFTPEKLLKSMFDDSIEEFSSVGFVRTLTNYSLKFLELLEKIEILGVSVEGALQTIFPPIFFKIRPFYVRVLQNFNFNQCKKMTLLFQEIEKEIKSNNSLAEEIFWGRLLTLQNDLKVSQKIPIYKA